MGYMTTPLITVFVRHAPRCKYRGDEFCKRCNCKKHLRWSRGGKQYRQATGGRTWADAETAKRNLEDQLAGRVPVAAGATGQMIRAAYDAFLKGKKVKGISTEAYN